MTNERLSRISKYIVIALGTIAIAALLFKYIFPIALPFLIGWGIALAVRPIARLIGRKTRIPERVASPVLAVLFLLLAVGGAVGLLIKLLSEGWELLSELAESGELRKIISGILNPFDGRFGGEYSEELKEYLGNTVKSLVSNLLGGLAGLLSGIVSGIPKILLFMLATVISTVYFCIDLDKINGFVMKKLPENAREHILRFKKNSLGVMLKYARSYLIIMLITFLIMLIGLSVLKVKYALLFSAVLALLDALPLFGVGTALAPYSIVCFAGGNPRLGVGLLILLLVNEVVRQIIEPKILGKNLGIHPLATVILLYAGYSLLGFMGLLLLPLAALVINGFFKKAKSSEVGER